jgi:CheY-like chemotaxis protein
LPQVRARVGPVHALAITARGLAEGQARSLGVGFQAHLTKPFAPHRLVELLPGSPA